MSENTQVDECDKSVTMSLLSRTFAIYRFATFNGVEARRK